jgi:hypothetical protein
MNYFSITLRFVLSMLLLFPSHALEAGENNTYLAKTHSVAPDGDRPNKVTIFIGDDDEASSHSVQNSSSFTKETYGTNYLFAYNQPRTIKALIGHLPKATSLNMVGYGIGAETATSIAVDLATTKRINVLLTIAPKGKHPDFALIKQSVNTWVTIASEQKTPKTTSIP